MCRSSNNANCPAARAWGFSAMLFIRAEFPGAFCSGRFRERDHQDHHRIEAEGGLKQAFMQRLTKVLVLPCTGASDDREYAACNYRLACWLQLKASVCEIGPSCWEIPNAELNRQASLR